MGKLPSRVLRQLIKSTKRFSILLSLRKLADKGARAQRLLWASTSTKNPDYSDVKYIETLIGPDTVNTVPLETINAYRDHGNPELRLEYDIGEANWIMARLPDLGSASIG